MNLWRAVEAGLLSGLILCALLGAVIIGSLALNAEMWLNDYPPDIRRKFGEMSRRARRQRIPVGVLFAAILIGTLAIGLVQLRGLASDGIGFVAAYVYSFVALTLFNAFDLLVLDWLVFVKLQPRFIVLPGTDGMDGYRDYSFHARAFLVGLIGTSVASGLVAGVVVLYEWLSGA